LRFGSEPLRQESAPHGPAPDAYLPPRLFDGPASRVGFAVDAGMRPEGAPAGLFLAGALALPRSGAADGLGWALASGLAAASAALGFLRAGSVAG
jgi:hypothetical protein